jgi:DnaJ-domain-containing protein 1
MQLPARLRDATLGDLLAQLYRARASGVLELDEGARAHAIHLRGGLVHAVEGAAPRFGDLTATLGVAERAAIERAWRTARDAGRIGQCLIAARIISHHHRDRVLDEQRARRLDALFLLLDAGVRFRAARALPPGAAEQSPMLPSRVLRGRPRGRERGARAVVSPARAEALAALGLPYDADPETARRRFRALVMELHPDRGGTAPRSEDRERRLRAVLDAWRTLSDSPG